MIIVTGGAGFIGSNLVKGLNDLGHEHIVIVDNLTNSSKHLNLNKLKFYDFIDKEDFIKNLPHFKSIKTIFHQGACSNTLETNGKYMMKNNYEYSKEILNFSLHNEIDFIYASSASVYGNGNNGFKEFPECEYPLNIYAYSKYQFDNYVREIVENKKNMNSQILGLRYFNVFGYQENHKGTMASVAFHLMNQINSGEEMKLFEGSENFLRDFIFIEDVIKMNLFFFSEKHNGIFNCGTGKARSFVDIANGLKDSFPEAKLKYTPFPKKLVGKYQTFTEANTKKLESIKYPHMFHSLEEGLQKYANKFKESKGYIL